MKDRQIRGQKIIKKMFGDLKDDSRPAFRDMGVLTHDYLFGEVWSRPGLALRDTGNGFHTGSYWQGKTIAYPSDRRFEQRLNPGRTEGGNDARRPLQWVAQRYQRVAGFAGACGGKGPDLFG